MATTLVPTSRAKGILFPFQKGPQGAPRGASGIELIKSNLSQLLSTKPGERVMRPTYGLFLDRLVFEQDPAVVAAIAKREILTKVGQFEPRAQIVDIQVQARDHTASIQVEFEFAGQRTSIQAELGS